MNLKDLKLEDIEVESVETDESRTSKTPSLFDFSPEDISQTEAALRGAAQGPTLGFSDEIIAGLKSMYEDVTGELRIDPNAKQPELDEFGRPVESGGEIYKELVAEERSKQKAASEAYPATYLGSEIAAGIIPALFTGGASAAGQLGKTVVKEGTKALAKKESAKELGKAALKTGATGAGYGGVSGAGMSEAESLPGLVEDTLTGAAYGGALGTATPVAGKALSEGSKAVVKGVDKFLEANLPSIRTGFKFGKKYGFFNEKINELLYDNTRELIDTMSKSFQKLGLEKKAAEKKASEFGQRYDVTEGIQDVAEQFRNQAESLLPSDAKQAQKIASDIEESFLKFDVKRQDLLKKVNTEIQKKVERSKNLQNKAISKGEASAVKEAEKSGASIEELKDIRKRFQEVSDVPYKTEGGEIAGKQVKFKDEYLDIETGEMVPYEYSKKYLHDTTPFKPSKVKVGEVDDQLAAQYTDEATGEVFTKTGPKSQFLDKDFSRLTLEDLSDLTSQYGQKGFDEKNPVYKELYKVVRNKLEEAGMDIPENKKEMFKLFQTMAVLGMDKSRLKYPNTEDVLALTKKIPGRMDLEKDILQRDVLKEGSELSKKLDDLRLLSDAKKYLGEGYASSTGETTKAGIHQKAISFAGEYGGKTYGLMSKPINKVANKVSQMTDEGLQYVNNKMSQSSSPGVQAMGRQLDYALQQEGPVKSSLIWSLSQNPAFRKSAQEFLPQADKELIKELGIEEEEPKIDTDVQEEINYEDMTSKEPETSMTEDMVEKSKSAVDRVAKQIGSGQQIPESHIDVALGAIEELPIDEIQKEALQDEVVKMETYSDAERLKAMLDSLKKMG